MKDAIGIPDSELRGATKSTVAKINVDTDGRLAFTAGVRQVLGTNPKEFDPRKYLGAGQKEMKEYYKTKVQDVRSEEHTSELQSRQYLVCRLLLEKKKTQLTLVNSYHT